MSELLYYNPEWRVMEWPGFQGKRKEADIQRWNEEYGENNWRLAWEMNNGEAMQYIDVFYKIYVPGYLHHFLKHPDEAIYLTDNFSYTYDKDIISRAEAFDPHALYNRPGRPNQFHNVALNIALEWNLGVPFRGNTPLQVREGKHGTPESEWPEGWRWSPGRIPAVRPELIRENDVEGWWEKGSIEDVYQTTKVLQVSR